MKSLSEKIVGGLVWGMFAFFTLYVGLAIFSPIALKLGWTDVGMDIQSVYRFTCHQRVERSMFLFGKDSVINFYSLDELQLLGVIPAKNPNMPAGLDTKIFNYPYVGNEVVGYKVAICIRCLALYLAVFIAAAVYLFVTCIKKKTIKIPWLLILLLVLPMMIDGVFQTIAEIFNFPWVPVWYIEDIPKRIITGGLFGIGFALFVFSNLKELVDEVKNEAKSPKK